MCARRGEGCRLVLRECRVPAECRRGPDECTRRFSFLSAAHVIADDVAEFPRKPIGWLKRNITDEADARLAFYLPLPADQPLPPELPEAPPRPQLPEGVVDAPLVRVFNFLRA